MKGYPLQMELIMSKNTYDTVGKQRFSFSGTNQWISAPDEDENTDMRSKILLPLNRTCTTKFNKDRIPPSDRRSTKQLLFKDRKTAQFQTAMCH